MGKHRNTNKKNSKKELLIEKAPEKAVGVQHAKVAKPKSKKEKRDKKKERKEKKHKALLRELEAPHDEAAAEGGKVKRSHKTSQLQRQKSQILTAIRSDDRILRVGRIKREMKAAIQKANPESKPALGPKAIAIAVRAGEAYLSTLFGAAAYNAIRLRGSKKGSINSRDICAAIAQKSEQMGPRFSEEQFTLLANASK